MSILDLMKLFSDHEEIFEGDFTPEELRDYLSRAQSAERQPAPGEWKENYFEFYDDVKDKSLKKQDW